jgi:hypothetical protein
MKTNALTQIGWMLYGIFAATVFVITCVIPTTVELFDWPFRSTATETFAEAFCRVFGIQ